MLRLLPLLPLLVAACAPMDWTRSDVAPEQVQADMKACRDQAWRETSWAPFAFADPFGRRYMGWPYYTPFADPYGDRFLEESRLANFCMRAKGYELAPVTR